MAVPLPTIPKEVLMEAYGRLGNNELRLSAEEIQQRQLAQKAKESRQARRLLAEKDQQRKAEEQEAKRLQDELALAQQQEQKRRQEEEEQKQQEEQRRLEQVRKREQEEEEQRRLQELITNAVRKVEDRLRAEHQEAQMALLSQLTQEMAATEKRARDAEHKSSELEAIIVEIKQQAETAARMAAQKEKDIVAEADRIAKSRQQQETTTPGGLFGENDFKAPQQPQPQEHKSSPPPPQQTEAELEKAQQIQALREHSAMIRENTMTQAYLWLNIGSRTIETLNRAFGQPFQTDGLHTRVDVALQKGVFTPALKKLSQEKWARTLFSNPLASIGTAFAKEFFGTHVDNLKAFEATGTCGYRQRADNKDNNHNNTQAATTTTTTTTSQKQQHASGCLCSDCIAFYQQYFNRKQQHVSGCTCGDCLTFYSQRLFPQQSPSQQCETSTTPLSQAFPSNVPSSPSWFSKDDQMPFGKNSSMSPSPNSSSSSSNSSSSSSSSSSMIHQEEPKSSEKRPLFTFAHDTNNKQQTMTTHPSSTSVSSAQKEAKVEEDFFESSASSCAPMWEEQQPREGSRPRFRNSSFVFQERSDSLERSRDREMSTHNRHSRYRQRSPPRNVSGTYNGTPHAGSATIIDPLSGHTRTPFQLTPRTRGIVDDETLNLIHKQTHTFEPLLGVLPSLLTNMATPVIEVA